MPDSADAAAVIRFTRFYEGIVTAFKRRALPGALTPAEARVLLAIRGEGETRGGLLAADLGMDRGQLSRVLWKLSDAGYATSIPSSGDRRSSIIALTPEGERACRDLDDLGVAAATALLSSLDAQSRRRLVASMRTIEALLGGSQ